MSLRLAFNCGRWHPTKEQFVSALSMIQNEERKRVCDFVFRRDVKTALIGRLLLRQAIRTCLHLRNDEITFGRTEHGRPILISDDPKIKDLNFDFNISHQDDLVVLACETKRRVGIDTMHMERPVGSSSTERFFELMKRQLSDQEWKWLHSNGRTESERLADFYRIWCMKESYVKAIGIGIGYSLSRLDCCMVDDISSMEVRSGDLPCTTEPSLYKSTYRTLELQIWPNTGQDHPTADACSTIIRSSFLRVDGQIMKEWMFEETVLLGKYLVCIAMENDPGLSKTNEAQSRHLASPTFHFLTINELLEGSQELSDNNDGEITKRRLLKEWDLYVEKEQQPNKSQ